MGKLEWSPVRGADPVQPAEYDIRMRYPDATLTHVWEDGRVPVISCGTLENTQSQLTAPFRLRYDKYSENWISPEEPVERPL